MYTLRTDHYQLLHAVDCVHIGLVGWQIERAKSVVR
jgi:hypothetical protein